MLGALRGEDYAERGRRGPRVLRWSGWGEEGNARKSGREIARCCPQTQRWLRDSDVVALLQRAVGLRKYISRGTVHEQMDLMLCTVSCPVRWPYVQGRDLARQCSPFQLLKMSNNSAEVILTHRTSRAAGMADAAWCVVEVDWLRGRAKDEVADSQSLKNKDVMSIYNYQNHVRKQDQNSMARSFLEVGETRRRSNANTDQWPQVFEHDWSSSNCINCGRGSGCMGTKIEARGYACPVIVGVARRESERRRNERKHTWGQAS